MNLNFRSKGPARLPKLAIDIDGVLADFQPVYIAFLEDLYPELAPFPTPNLLDYPDNWDYDKDRMRAIGWDDAEIAKRRKHAWSLIAESTAFWTQLPPYPTTHEDIRNLRALAEDGWSIYFMTQRPGGTAKFQSELWLMNAGMKFPFVPTTLIFANGEDKHHACRVLGIDAIIDDKPSTVASINAPTRRYLMDRPWNRSWFADVTQHDQGTADQEPVIKVDSVTDMLAVERQRFQEELEAIEATKGVQLS